MENYPLVDCVCLNWADDGAADRAKHGGHHKGCSEPTLIGDGFALWHIDEGIDHWVIAKDEADALAVVRENDGMTDADRGWEKEPPEVQRLSLAMAEYYQFRDDDTDESRSMLAEARREPTRRYVACSEY